jgi:hypothetical protein
VLVGLEELPIHLHFIVQIMLLDIQKAQKAIYAFESVGGGEFSFHSSLDDILDDEAEVQLHPNVKQWFHDICQYVLNAPHDRVDDTKYRVKVWYDEIIKQLEGVLQVGLMFQLSLHKLTPMRFSYSNGKAKQCTDRHQILMF